MGKGPTSAGRSTPRESLDNYLNPTWVWKGEMQGTLSNQVLVNVNGGWGTVMVRLDGVNTSCYTGKYD